MGESTAWSPHPAKDKNEFPEQIQTAALAPFHPRHRLGTDSPRDCAKGPFHQVRKTRCPPGHAEPAASCRRGAARPGVGRGGSQGPSPGPSAFLSLDYASLCPCHLFSFLLCPHVFVLIASVSWSVRLLATMGLCLMACLSQDPHLPVLLPQRIYCFPSLPLRTSFLTSAEMWPVSAKP